MLVFLSCEWGCHCGRVGVAEAAIELYGASEGAGKGTERTPTAIVMDVMGLWGWQWLTGLES